MIDNKTSNTYIYIYTFIFSHNIKLWVSLTVRASMIVVIAGFPLPGPPRGDGRCYYSCWTPSQQAENPKDLFL